MKSQSKSLAMQSVPFSMPQPPMNLMNQLGNIDNILSNIAPGIKPITVQLNKSQPEMVNDLDDEDDDESGDSDDSDEESEEESEEESQEESESDEEVHSSDDSEIDVIKISPLSIHLDTTTLAEKPFENEVKYIHTGDLIHQIEVPNSPLPVRIVNVSMENDEILPENNQHFSKSVEYSSIQKITIPDDFDIGSETVTIHLRKEDVDPETKPLDESTDPEPEPTETSVKTHVEPSVDYNSMSVPELKSLVIAKQLTTGVNKLKKQELIQLLQKHA
jgi:hypothetical protein